MSLGERGVVAETISVGGLSCAIALYEEGSFMGRGTYSSCVEVRKFRGLTAELLGEEAVLKVLGSKDEARPAAAIYENEVRALRMLNGEHSPRFSRCLSHWASASPPLYCILLEKCPYGSLLDLSDHLAAQGRAFSQLEVLFFLREVLRAVRAMHRLRLLHRDLKLQNVLIGHDFDVKLIDFGLAKIGEDGQDPSDNRYEGTPFYMSPEVLAEVDYSYEVDMWAVGVMLYYLMHFTFPFCGSTKAELKKEVLTAEVKFKKKSEYKELIQIARMLLSRDKESRPTAAELLRDPIFERLEEDIKWRIEHKYRNYFMGKLGRSSWKREVISDRLELEVVQVDRSLSDPAAQREEIRQRLLSRVMKKVERAGKVRIVRVVHSKKYGFFFLLSNLSLVAYFNNCKILRFAAALLKSASSNEEAVLCFIYRQHFREEMAREAEADPEAQFEEPNCTISKVCLVGRNLFVRLSNNVLQVYIARPEGRQDGSLLFGLQLLYNSSTLSERQITVLPAAGQRAVYEDFAAASASPHSRYVHYVKQVFEVMLDNSLLSLQRMQLQRPDRA